jgi:hypothetical protein
MRARAYARSADSRSDSNFLAASDHRLYDAEYISIFFIVADAALSWVRRLTTVKWRTAPGDDENYVYAIALQGSPQAGLSPF